MDTPARRHCVRDPLTEFMAHYAGAGTQARPETSEAPATIEEALKRRIIDGNAVGLTADLDTALASYPALDIINTILLDGMKTVGELFGSGQMQLPFVLQSAETMKQAVSHLERFMEHSAGIQKGTMVLATVKGDVHDIGKNLVDIILSNNGYKVVNLGIKVPVEAMLAAVEEHRADAIGMSGLLVKSTLIMKENLELMRSRGVHVPVVLGGAALTRRFVEQDLRSVYGGNLAYASDAFEGLAFMERIASGHTAHAAQVSAERGAARTARAEAAAALRDRDAEAAPSEPVIGRSAVAMDAPVPAAPFLGSKVVRNIRIEKVYEYINETALIRGQWQMRRGKRSDEEYQRQLREEILPELERVKLAAKRDGILQPAVAYGYFPCAAAGEDLVVYRPKELPEDGLYDVWPRSSYSAEELIEWQRFSFPRQHADRHLCIADYFRPAGSGTIDVCAFQIVTMGASASEHTAALFRENRYQEYLYMHGLSVECAEALAEYWHRSVRLELGIAGNDADDITRLFSQGYQGSRYSFGYPACPRLEDQVQLFELLRPERIGVTLTEEYQLVPEQSTSAIVVHHPAAKYFIVRDQS